MAQKVVYASYGSNMFTDRFMVYINGGTIEGASRTYPGCRDSTPPAEKVILSSDALEIYYCRDSTVWGESPYNDVGSGIFGGLALLGVKPGIQFGGVEKIDPAEVSLQSLVSSDSSVLAGYVVSGDQFVDIVTQENRRNIGDFDLPEELLDELTLENPVISLRGRTGEDAIKLKSGEVVEIDIKSAYDSLMYLGEIEVDGEMVKVVTFTNSRSYELAAAQAYVNMATANIPVAARKEIEQLGKERIEELLGVSSDDPLHRLNPASANYVEMISNGIVEIGGGQGDWTRENALQYVLTKPPFSQGQLPELATQVNDFINTGRSIE